MDSKSIADNINRRFSPDFDWPEGFVRARENEDGGFSLYIGPSDIQFDKDGKLVGGGTDLNSEWGAAVRSLDNLKEYI